MRTTRLFTASLCVLGLVGSALLPPLHALRLMIEAERTGGATPVKKHIVTVAGAQLPAPTALPSWQPRWSLQGSLRRVYLPQAQDLPGSWDERARQLLQQVDSGIAVGADDLRTTAVRRSPGGMAVRLQQMHAGLPVWGAEVVVAFAPDARPLLVASELQSTLPAAKVFPAPAVTSTDAEGIAMRAVGALGSLAAPAQVDLFWLSAGGTWRRAWCVRFVASQPAGDWQVQVDALHGGVLGITDRTRYENGRRRAASVTAAARVFLPDPVTATGNTSLRDEDDAAAAVPDSAYTAVTLRGLEPAKSGVLALHGVHVRIVDWESPDVSPVTSTQASFVYDRAHSGFEDVMVYHHIDTMQRWFQSLGFDDANNRAQPADAHGFWGEDNSRFLPTLGLLSFGEGGVDDAEDAAVIVHEYAHATQYDIVPTWGVGGHTDAMGEGFGDYLANSYAWAQQPQRVQEWNGVFRWDGHNEFWPGRVVIDPSLRYPQDATASRYTAGTLWCSALTDALYLLADRTVVDRLVLQHHYLLTGSATMEDAANAILLSDLVLHEGRNVPDLTDVFVRWGMLSDQAAEPVRLVHEPPELAAADAPLPVIEARLVAIENGHEPHRVVLHARHGSGNIFSHPMRRVQGDHWSGVLPGDTGTDVAWSYWFEAFDALERSTVLPSGGKHAAFTFVMGEVADDFEDDQGWTTAAGAPPALKGHWQRAVPTGTAWQPMRDHTARGSVCWVTENAAAGLPASEADVDDGGTVLLSPVWDVSDASTLILSYWRWFATNASSDDLWRVRVSGDAGSTWHVLEETDHGIAAWEKRQFDIAALVPDAAALQLEFLVEDGGAASLVEAALDDVVLRTNRVVDTPSHAPAALSLRVHPNPFNPATTVTWTMPIPGPAQLDVLDVRGRHVRRLWSAFLPAGPRQVVWDGRDETGRLSSSGVYLLHLRTPTGSRTDKITLLR